MEEILRIKSCCARLSDSEREVDDHKRFIAAVRDDLALAINDRNWWVVETIHEAIREHLQAINGPESN